MWFTVYDNPSVASTYETTIKYYLNSTKPICHSHSHFFGCNCYHISRNKISFGGDFTLIWKIHHCLLLVLTSNHLILLLFRIGFRFDNALLLKMKLIQFAPFFQLRAWKKRNNKPKRIVWIDTSTWIIPFLDE